jgi:hypothetical protein
MLTPDALSPEPFPNPPSGRVARAVLALRRALHALADALVPAEVAVLDHSIGAVRTQLLGEAARLGIADRLADGPKDAAALARETDCDPDALHRALRCLAGYGIFTLAPDGRFSNNRLSEALRLGQLSRSREWCRYFASASNLAAWGQLSRTLGSGERAFEHAHGMNVWRWFEAHPEERELFAQAMMGITVGMAPVVAGLYPFDEVQTICDVGGGRGTLISELLLRHPHLRGMLCDAEGVLESARPLLRRRGVEARVALVPKDFFEEVPTGADAYLLKNVLHDWDDARSLRVLETCRKAMAQGARLLVCESFLEKNQTEGFAPFSDVQMMMVCDGGRERSRAEYAALLERAGFKVGRVFENPIVSVIEGRI